MGAVEKYKKAFVKIALIVVCFLAVYLLFAYLLPFFAPFVIAIILALISEPLINLLEKRAKIHRKLGALISLLLTIGILGFLVAVLSIKLYRELVSLQHNIGSNIDSIIVYITSLLDKLTVYYKNLPPDLAGAIDENLKGLAPKLTDIIQSLASYIIDTITSLPKVAIFLIVTVLATFFISSDRRKIREFIYRQFPDSFMERFAGVKSKTFSALFGYLKAILILMSFTFIEVSIGLLILGVDYAILFGIVVAVCEVIPVLGTGLVMVPWILWQLAQGNISLAIGLTVIWLIGVTIRQIMEPKIVGSQIGLHPLVTLIAIYIGLSLFGVPGMLIGPISVIIIRNLQEAGLFRIWND